MNKTLLISPLKTTEQKIKAAAILLCVALSIFTSSNVIANILDSNSPLQVTDKDVAANQNTLSAPADSNSGNSTQDPVKANAQAGTQTDQTLFTQASIDQIKLLPFAPPALRSLDTRHQRLARHSQIVHSKVLAWLDLPYAQSTGFRPVTLDLFVPNNSVAGDSRLPLLLVLHEGNPQHFHSQYSRHFADLPELFANIAASGVTVAAINYRSPKETNLNGQVNDLRAAIRWLELNAEDYRLGQHAALWSFGQSGDIVQAHLLHRPLAPANNTPATSAAGAIQLTAVVMWQPTQLHHALTDVPILAINVQTATEHLPANQQLIHYRHFGAADELTSAAITDEKLTANALPENALADNNNTKADPRLDALSRSLQFLLKPQR